MNLLAIIGSPRKGKATDTLVDIAIEGVLKKSNDASVDRIYLSDNEINYCKDCLTLPVTFPSKKAEKPFEIHWQDRYAP